jgi:hypothetical protein
LDDSAVDSWSHGSSARQDIVTTYDDATQLIAIDDETAAASGTTVTAAGSAQASDGDLLALDRTGVAANSALRAPQVLRSAI